MVPLAEADPDPFALEGLDSLYDGLERGIDGIPSPKPEIEEITCDNEPVDREWIVIRDPGSAEVFPSPETGEEPDEFLGGGIPRVFQMGIGEKDRLHIVAPGKKAPRERRCTLKRTVLSISAPLSDLPLPFKAGNREDPSLLPSSGMDRRSRVADRRRFPAIMGKGRRNIR